MKTFRILARKMKYIFLLFLLVGCSARRSEVEKSKRVENTDLSIVLDKIESNRLEVLNTLKLYQEESRESNDSVVISAGVTKKYGNKRDAVVVVRDSSSGVVLDNNVVDKSTVRDRSSSAVTEKKKETQRVSTSWVLIGCLAVVLVFFYFKK